jgi:hypothetical protein
MRFDSDRPIRGVRTPSRREPQMFRSPLVYRLAATIALLVGAAVGGGWKWGGH